MARRLILKEDQLTSSFNPPVGYKSIGYNGLTFSERQSNGDIVPIGGSNTNTNEWTYDLGQYVSDKGGVIFHRYKDGVNENYLVVSINNISTSSVWSNINNVAIGATAESLWDGLSNSNAIVGQGSASGAAVSCLAYSVGAIDDWYLPAVDELSLLWHNRFNVNRTLFGSSSFGTIVGAIEIGYNNYWSSTERSNINAWYFSFDGGYVNPTGKNSAAYVRAVRKFSL